MVFWDDWNREHVKKHGCTVEDVKFVCSGDHVLIKESYKDRFVVAGPGPDGRFVTVVIGADPNGPPGTWYPFSARPSSKQEIRKYEQERAGYQ